LKSLHTFSGNRDMHYWSALVAILKDTNSI
jgi:hypothetical protein